MSYIVIRSIASVSPLGADPAEVIRAYGQGIPRMQEKIFSGKKAWAAALPDTAEQELNELLEKFPAYKNADRSVAMGIVAAEKAWKASGWPAGAACVVNAASSRGATGTWENYHDQFIASGSVPVKASPTTTLGNIATHIARHLKLNQATIEHSITCGSGLQALANGMAWLRSGMADRVLAVASEAPLTGFTVAQMQALGIYSKETDAYPCKSGYNGPDKKNTMVLGEAAVAVCMERTDELQPGDVFIASIGFGLEELFSLTSIHPEGAGFQQSMNAAMKDTALLPRIVIAHMPGTIKGDQAERAAIANVFEKYPAVLSNKWLAGHTLGASGLLSVEWAALLLNGKAYMDFPYPAFENSVPVPGPVMVNAMGFGGNAISIVLSRKF